MTKVLAGGFLAVLVAEIMGLVFSWGWALPLGGVALGLFGLQVTGRLARGRGGGPEGAAPNVAEEFLLRWKSQTEELIRWADCTRGDWDRHLRPKLARDFLVATKQKEAAGVNATGLIVFGEDLWQWVDPQNVSAVRRDEPGPGRDALDQILQKLEQV